MKMQQLQRNGQQPEANQAQATASANAVVRSSLDEDRQSMYGADMLRTIVLIALSGYFLLGLFLNKKIKPVILLAGLLVLSSYDLLAVSARYLNADSYVDPADLENNSTPSRRPANPCGSR